MTFFVNVRIHTILNDFVSFILTYEVKKMYDSYGFYSERGSKLLFVTFPQEYNGEKVII